MKQPSIEIDGDLIKSYLSGDQKALKQLIGKWHVTFCNKAYWILKDADSAKDVAQDSWQIIIKKLKFLKEPDKFGFWAMRIVSNKAIDHLNKYNRERIELVVYQREHNFDSKPYKENDNLKIIIRNGIIKLPQAQQNVLRLFYTEDYSLNQISEILNISIGTVKSRLFHAREKLKLILKNKVN